MMILGSLTIQYRRWLMGDADEKVASIFTTNAIWIMVQHDVKMTSNHISAKAEQKVRNTVAAARPDLFFAPSWTE